MALYPDAHDFAIWKGATFRAHLELFNDEAETQPRDLTNHTAELIIRNRPNGDARLTLTTENGGITLGGVTGTIDIVISAAATAAITWKTGHYDLLVTAAGGDTDALLYGTFTADGV
jgi:hypothetical protein